MTTLTSDMSATRHALPKDADTTAWCQGERGGGREEAKSTGITISGVTLRQLEFVRELSSSWTGRRGSRSSRWRG